MPLYHLKIEFARVKKIKVSGQWGFKLSLKGISHEFILQDEYSDCAKELKNLEGEKFTPKMHPGLIAPYNTH